MRKFFFPAWGVGFSELRQIALTFCHSNVTAVRGKFYGVFVFRYSSFGA